MLFFAFCLAQICSLAGLILYKVNYDFKNRPPCVFLPKHAILAEIIKNYLLGIPWVRSLKNRSGSLTTGEELFSVGFLARLAKKTSEIYKDVIFKTFQDAHWLEGKRVLEIGPGSHLAVPLSFIGAGAAKVVSIDKYGEVKFRRKEREIYEKTLSILSDQEKMKVQPIIQELDLGKTSNLDSYALSYLPDVSIDSPDCVKRLPEASFDLIVSCNTLEHIKDIKVAFQNMRLLLKKGGIFIHRVDAGSHYAISRYTKNSLAQFIPSDGAYNLMFSNRDAPTRRLLNDYLNMAEAQKIPSIKFYTDEIATSQEISSSYGFLYPRFKSFSQEDVSKVGFIIVAQKE